MRICICGGGALGHVCAAVFSSCKGVEVSIYSGHPNQWHKTIRVGDLKGKQYNASIKKISDRPDEVIANQDIVFLCLPGYLIEKTLKDIKPYIDKALVGSVVSNTGFFFFAHKILEPNARLFGFQRVPYIARILEYGKSAQLLGYKSHLYVACEGVEQKDCLKELLTELFLTPVDLLNSYLEVSLTNSNPILHTSRLYTMFKGHENDIFNRHILFYKEWTLAASELMIAMDGEFFQLLRQLNITSIPSLLDYYQCEDALSLTEKIRSITAFESIRSPMHRFGEGWKVDFTSRYFTEDFPFGLRWIYELASKNHVNKPNIDKVYDWGMRQLTTVRF